MKTKLTLESIEPGIIKFKTEIEEFKEIDYLLIKDIRYLDDGSAESWAHSTEPDRYALGLKDTDIQLIGDISRVVVKDIEKNGNVKDVYEFDL